jgi:hypothetical protein
MVSSYYQFDQEQSRRTSFGGTVVWCLGAVAVFCIGRFVVTPFSESISITIPVIEYLAQITSSSSSSSSSIDYNVNTPSSITALHNETQNDKEADSTREDINIMIDESDEDDTYEQWLHEEHDGNIMLESGSINDVRYYSCNNFVSRNTVSPDPGSTLDIVLLQSTSYTIDDWKRSGMLSYFCNATLASIAPAVRVVALDLPATAKHDELRNILGELVIGLQTHPSYPVKIAGLITPSASGSVVMDWLLSSRVSDDESTEQHSTTRIVQDDIRNYVSSWIPVASNGILHIPQSMIETAVSGLPILSIHGDQDISGKRSSNLLAQSAMQTEVTVQELRGRHPVYFESPKEFVRTVLQYLVQQRLYQQRVQ